MNPNIPDEFVHPTRRTEYEVTMIQQGKYDLSNFNFNPQIMAGGIMNCPAKQPGFWPSWTDCQHTKLWHRSTTDPSHQSYQELERIRRRLAKPTIDVHVQSVDTNDYSVLQLASTTGDEDSGAAQGRCDFSWAALALTLAVDTPTLPSYVSARDAIAAFVHVTSMLLYVIARYGTCFLVRADALVRVAPFSIILFQLTGSVTLPIHPSDQYHRKQEPTSSFDR